MIEPRKEYKTIDEYIGTFPKNVQAILEELRQAIKDSAPNAKEAISYQMPTFKLNGNLVYFAAFRNHISFFPTSSAIEAFGEKLSPYKTSKGTVRFPINESIPFDLIKEMVRFRVKENEQKKNNVSPTFR